MEIQIKREWHGEVIFNHETNTASVVAILINPRLGYIVRQIQHDNEGRILNILLQLDDHTFNIVNIYALQTDNDKWPPNIDPLVQRHDTVIASLGNNKNQLNNPQLLLKQ